MQTEMRKPQRVLIWDGGLYFIKGRYQNIPGVFTAAEEQIKRFNELEIS